LGLLKDLDLLYDVGAALQQDRLVKVTRLRHEERRQVTWLRQRHSSNGRHGMECQRVELTDKTSTTVEELRISGHNSLMRSVPASINMSNIQVTIWLNSLSYFQVVIHYSLQISLYEGFVFTRVVNAVLWFNQNDKRKGRKRQRPRAPFFLYDWEL